MAKQDCGVWLHYPVFMILIASIVLMTVFEVEHGLSFISIAAIILLIISLVRLQGHISYLKGAFEQFEKRFARLESTFEAHVRKKKAH